jgi:hypothetical protein
VRLASPIGSAAGGSVNLSSSLSNVVKLAAHPKFVWVFNANCDGTIIYNDPVFIVICPNFGTNLFDIFDSTNLLFKGPFNKDWDGDVPFSVKYNQ